MARLARPSFSTLLSGTFSIEGKAAMRRPIALLAFMAALWHVVLAQEGDEEPEAPSTLLMPSNATSTMVVVSTAGFGDTCSEEVNQCIRELQCASKTPSFRPAEG